MNINGLPPQRSEVLLHTHIAEAVSLPAGTIEGILGSAIILPSDIGPKGWVRGVALFSYTNGGNNKTLRIRLGGLAGAICKTMVVVSSASMEIGFWISARNSLASQVGETTAASSSYPLGGHVATTVSPMTSALDWSLPLELVATGQKASAGDAVTLERFSVEVAYKT